jgi:hypothetical protein
MDDLQIEEARILRNRKLAEALQQQSMTPDAPGQMVGNTFVKQSPLSGLAKALNMVNARKGMEFADQESKALGQQQQARRGADMSMLAGALGGRPASPGGVPNDMIGTTDPLPAQTPAQALSATLPMVKDPQLQQFGLQAAQGAQARQENQTFQAAQGAEQRAARLQERELAITAQSERAAADRAFREQQARAAAQDRQGLAQMVSTLRQDQRPPVAVVGPDGKPVLVAADQAVGRQPFDKKSGSGLPPTALKMQNEILEEINIAGNIQADLSALNQQLDDGKFRVGPIRNLVNAGRNNMGLANEESNNFNSFKTTLERLRNDSLRLNKGVQTEGDAQRAWQELMGSINDPAVVKQRLAEIQKINERAVGQKKLQIDTMRSNFGMDSMDVAPFANQDAAVGGAPQRRSTDVATADPLGLRKKK